MLESVLRAFRSQPSSGTPLEGGEGAQKANRQDATLIELYKLCVEMADRVSARRGTTNSFFLAVNTALTTTLGLIVPKSPDLQAGTSPLSDYGPLLAAVSGLILCVTWWLMLRSYRDLNRAKFAVIVELEDSLPARPFADEWKSLKRDRIKGWRGRYAELGEVERIVPAVFGMIYLVVALLVIRGAS